MMKRNIIQEYERNLVETAVKEARAKQKLEFAQWMMSKDYSREEILDVTGVDILEI
jgi:ribosomal protein L3